MFKKILCTIISLTITLSTTLSFTSVHAETPTLPGARSEFNSETGDVFLGGNYIEVGVSKHGSFGTSTLPTDASFHRATGVGLGLISDGDGWNIGNGPTTGDFFIPGSPEERYILSYKIDNIAYDYPIADRIDDSNFYTTNKFISVPTARDESDVDNNKLKAVVSGITNENVKFDITYSFGVDDLYYDTSVTVKNNNDTEITDVRFVRSFDPDQDQELNNAFETYNKVICNPDTTKDGSSTNYAMVVARGPETAAGFFFLAFDNRAKASQGVSFSPSSSYLNGLWDSAPVTQEHCSTDESLALTKEDIDNNVNNGYTFVDSAIAITFNLGNLAHSASADMNYYSSLDPDVEGSMSSILTATKATVADKTDTSITIDTTEGYEYSIDNGQTWQESGTFTGLRPQTSYTILSRIKATPGVPASDPTEIVAETKGPGQHLQSLTVSAVTEDSVLIRNVDGCEYSIDNGATWQTSNSFTGLTPETSYTVKARYKTTDTTATGTNVLSVSFTTSKAEAGPEIASNVTVDAELSGNIPVINISKKNIYNAINDAEINEAIAGPDNVTIKLTGQEYTPSTEELGLVNSKKESDETIGAVMDLNLKYFKNDQFKKNITETENFIFVTIDIPSALKKTGRKFSMIRLHTNADSTVSADKLEDYDTNPATYTLKSNKFSAFFLTYVDTPVNTGDNTGNNTSNDKNVSGTDDLINLINSTENGKEIVVNCSDSTKITKGLLTTVKDKKAILNMKYNFGSIIINGNNIGNTDNPEINITKCNDLQPREVLHFNTGNTNNYSFNPTLKMNLPGYVNSGEKLYLYRIENGKKVFIGAINNENGSAIIALSDGGEYIVSTLKANDLSAGESAIEISTILK